jgi:hypothetical protein
MGLRGKEGWGERWGREGRDAKGKTQGVGGTGKGNPIKEEAKEEMEGGEGSGRRRKRVERGGEELGGGWREEEGTKM